jgi:uncharacterized repeat protein (TIGR03803 family)
MAVSVRAVATSWLNPVFWLPVAMAWLLPRAGAGEWSHVRLYSFGQTNAGAGPKVALIEGRDGALYGTTYFGGSADAGTVFRIDKQGGNYTNLHSFTGRDGDGKWPYAALLQSRDGALYGTTTFGGQADQGTVFKLNPDGSGYAVLWSCKWNEGAYPYGTLIEGTDGRLYGTANVGGDDAKGTVFQLDKPGTNCVRLHSFGGVGDGGYPQAGLVEGSDGALYGTTTTGGTNDGGTVFQLSKAGTNYTVRKHLADSDGTWPTAALLEGAAGAMYGTAFNGGTNGAGTVFKLDQAGTNFTVLKHFGHDDGAYPAAALVAGDNGVLYGTTVGGSFGGTVFQINPDGSGHTILRAFTYNDGDGHSPRGNVIQSQDGALYGTTDEGGDLLGGTVFALFPEPRSWFTGWTASSSAITSCSAAGAADTLFYLQATTNLTATNWWTVATNQASPLGALTFTNLPAEWPALFYRLAAPR